MKIKKTIFYFIYLIVFVAALFATNILFQISDEQVQAMNGDLWIFLLLVPMVAYGLIGALLAFPNLCAEVKKAGKWKINCYKLLILGIPLFLLSISYFLASIFMTDGSPVYIPIPIWILGGPVQRICKIALGFIVVNSFYKKERIKVDTPARNDVKEFFDES